MKLYYDNNNVRKFTHDKSTLGGVCSKVHLLTSIFTSSHSHTLDLNQSLAISLIKGSNNVLVTFIYIVWKISGKFISSADDGSTGLTFNMELRMYKLLPF